MSGKIHGLGHGALEVWNAEAMSAAPIAVQIWIAVMGLTLLSSIFFVRRHQAPRWVLAGFLCSLTMSKGIAPAVGIVTFSGFVACLHLIFWSPGWVLLIRERLRAKSKWKFYQLWSWLVILVVAISFVFDARDAALYLFALSSKAYG